MEPLRVYVEYRLIPERRQEWQERLRAWQQQLSRLPVLSYAFYEGVEQPGVIVEEYQVPDQEAYRRLREERLAEGNPDASWQILPCVQGGREKLHVWAFAPIRLGGSP